MSVLLNEERARAILLDIEGTTTPVEYVIQILFPYAHNHAMEFLQQHHSTVEVSTDIDGLRKEYEIDLQHGLNPPVWRDDSANSELDSIVAFVHWLMDRDRKSTALKSLQGKIWEAGYRSGEFLGEVYADVPFAFSRWHMQRKDICIFSSGSVLAQKLLFAHTTAGDLTPFIRQYFDTTAGAKTEAESYHRIAAAVGLRPPEIIFLSDVITELDAARSAGMQTALCVRPGRPQPDKYRDPIIHTFDEISP